MGGLPLRAVLGERSGWEPGAAAFGSDGEASSPGNRGAEAAAHTRHGVSNPGAASPLAQLQPGRRRPHCLRSVLRSLEVVAEAERDPRLSLVRGRAASPPPQTTAAEGRGRPGAPTFPGSPVFRRAASRGGPSSCKG